MQMRLWTTTVRATRIAVLPTRSQGVCRNVLNFHVAYACVCPHVDTTAQSATHSGDEDRRETQQGVARRRVLVRPVTTLHSRGKQRGVCSLLWECGRYLRCWRVRDRVMLFWGMLDVKPLLHILRCTVGIQVCMRHEYCNKVRNAREEEQREYKKRMEEALLLGDGSQTQLQEHPIDNVIKLFRPPPAAASS